jgi:hypothetical protein
MSAFKSTNQVLAGEIDQVVINENEEAEFGTFSYQKNFVGIMYCKYFQNK